MYRFFSIFLFFFVLAFVSSFFVGPFIEHLLASTKLGQGLVDGARLEMSVDYLGKINFWTALTGADFSGTSIEVKYSGNPHSSIIRAHHLFGIFYLFVIIAMVTLVVFSMRTFKGKFVTASLTLIILFRSLTEPVLFPTSMDFFVFLYFFIAIDDRKSLKGRTGWAPPYDLANLRSGPGIHAKNFAATSVFD
uniref:hypothetical protein n=1 Tax=Marivivens donghaensis TaxID=1699413 RepID=UPI003F69AD8F